MPKIMVNVEKVTYERSWVFIEAENDDEAHKKVEHLIDQSNDADEESTEVFEQITNNAYFGDNKWWEVVA